MGERPEEAGELATLSPPASVPARGSGGSAPLFRPGRGNREGAREEVGGAGGAGVRPSLGRGVSGGGKACSFCFLFFDCFCFLFSFYLFISFSVLFHLKYFGIL